eukprot:scaffold111352_cov37-Prasinocladus_malaysianus.AAC.2
MFLLAGGACIGSDSRKREKMLEARAFWLLCDVGVALCSEYSYEDRQTGTVFSGQTQPEEQAMTDVS